MNIKKIISIFVLPISLLFGCSNPSSNIVYHYVNFNTDGGNYIEPVKVEEGKTIKKPVNPVKESSSLYEYTFSNWYLDDNEFDFLTPIVKDITLKAKWLVSTIEYKYVYFDTNGGDPSFIRPLTVKKGENVQPPVSPTKQDFIFDNWCLQEDLDNQNNFFDFNQTPILDDTTIYARFRKSIHKIFFDLNGGKGSISSCEVNDGDNALNIKPENPVHDFDDTYRYNFVCWELNNSEFDFSSPVTPLGDITLKAKWEKVTRVFYNVNFENNTHLYFSIDDHIPSSTDFAESGQPFKFHVVSNYLQDNEVYKIPNTFNIYVGDNKTKLAPFEYEINFIDEFHSIADVTIFGSSVYGDILIKDNIAELATTFDFKVWSHYGVNCDTEYGTETKIKGVDKVITFSKIEGSNYSLPTQETIFIKVNNGEWISANSTTSQHYCSYHESTGELSVITNLIYKIEFKVRAANYNLFEDISFDDINNYSTNGLAENYFCLGDRFVVPVNGINHIVKIIDFNHDVTNDGKTAGITFEFENLICSYNDTLLKSTYIFEALEHEKQNIYRLSAVEQLTNSVLNMMSEEVSKYIKTVYKETYLHYDRPSIVPKFEYKLFLLSGNEYLGSDNSESNSDSIWSSEEGRQYAYYKTHPLENKHSAKNETEYSVYWTRSPSTKYFTMSLAVESQSIVEKSRFDTNNAMFSIAPAFCI